MTKASLINRYAESNIPVIYWMKDVAIEFYGPDDLKNKYIELTADLKKTYRAGRSVCFAGSAGCGKSMTCTSILKRVIESGIFSALYTTLPSMVSLIRSSSHEQFLGRQELIFTDFLVIDEFDPRHMGSDAAADLFARILEDIFRIRQQNQLPTLMCTNALGRTAMIKSFTGDLKIILDSLLSSVEMIPVSGKDMRKITEFNMRKDSLITDLNIVFNTLKNKTEYNKIELVTKESNDKHCIFSFKLKENEKYLDGKIFFNGHGHFKSFEISDKLISRPFEPGDDQIGLPFYQELIGFLSLRNIKSEAELKTVIDGLNKPNFISLKLSNEVNK